MALPFNCAMRDTWNLSATGRIRPAQYSKAQFTISIRRLTALATVRVGNAAAPMEATGIEQPASAARDALGITVSAFPALLLLITMIGLSVALEIVEEPAPRGTLAFQLAAPAAFPCLPAVARPTRLAKVARACSGEQPFTVTHGFSRLQGSTGNHRRHRHRWPRMRGSRRQDRPESAEARRCTS